MTEKESRLPLFSWKGGGRRILLSYRYKNGVQQTTASKIDLILVISSKKTIDFRRNGFSISEENGFSLLDTYCINEQKCPLEYMN